MPEQKQNILGNLGQDNKSLVKTVYLLDSEISFVLELLENCQQKGIVWGDPQQFERQRSLLKRKLEAIE